MRELVGGAKIDRWIDREKKRERVEGGYNREKGGAYSRIVNLTLRRQDDCLVWPLCSGPFLHICVWLQQLFTNNFVNISLYYYFISFHLIKYHFKYFNSLFFLFKGT